MARHFLSLKLRLIRNGLRGRRVRIVLFVAGVIFGTQFAILGFALLAAPPHAASARAAIPPIGFTAVFLGWAFLPLLGFGVDETLDPERLALLPLRRRDLITGLLVASGVGVGPLATLIALSGALAGYGSGAGGKALIAIAVVEEFVACVCVARALTTGLSRLLRSRKARDLSAVVISLLGAGLGLLGQLPRLLAGGHGLSSELAARVASVLRWTPPGLIGRSVVDADGGRPGTSLAGLVGGLALVVLLLWWWAVTLDRLSTEAQTVTPSRSPGARARKGREVTTLFPRWTGFLPRNRVGAVAAKDLRYLWRDPMVRAQRLMSVMLTIGAVLAGAVVPGLRRPDIVLTTPVVVWWLNLVTLNQFGVDRSSYWMNVAANGDPRDDLIGKNVAAAMVAVPIYVVVAVGLAAVTGGWRFLPVATASAAGLLAVEFALGNVTSVRLAMPMPESGTNLWANRQGRGCGTVLLGVLALLANFVLIGPIAAVVVAGWRLWHPLLVISIPLSLAYGALLYWVGLRVGSEWLRTHQVELLEELGPREAA